MKKLFLFSMMCLLALSMQAQRCAVLDFQIGTGITEDDIDGISFNFRSNFRPTGYTMLERTQINRAIKELGFDRTDMTMQQMLQLGRTLDASMIVVGTINKFLDEYSVDIRVIYVSTGITAATEGITFERTAYRTSMESLAQILSSKLTSSENETYNSSTSLPKKLEF